MSTQPDASPADAGADDSMLPWTFFSSAFASAGESMVRHANLTSKVYFPRLIIPVSAVVTSFADFLISVLILIVLMCSTDRFAAVS